MVEAETGVALSGAQISVPALGIGVLARDEGRFVLPGVPAGTHELRVELVGHLAITQSVTVGEGETVFLELRMARSVLQIEGVVGYGHRLFRVACPAALLRDRLRSQDPGRTGVAAGRGLLPESRGLGRCFRRPAGVVQHQACGGFARVRGQRQPARAWALLRTLVLLNGRRQVYVPARLAGGRFVDVNVFPSIALDRIEVLKEGASAIYGSDAVGGVANFLTRSDFEGIEVEGRPRILRRRGRHQRGRDLGTSLGRERPSRRLGRGGHAAGAEPGGPGLGAARLHLPAGGAWSYTGNPGAFLMPRLTGTESKADFVAALSDAQFGGWGGVLIDPQCRAFGGHPEAATCRFRYQPWDNLLQANRITRLFAESNGELGDNSRYHIEALWSEAVTPEWYTTPSFPPISPYNGAQVVEAGNPGRQQFCRAHGASAGFATTEGCLEDDWYFYGRLVGNSGPGRTLRRESRTQRIAASMEHDFEAFGGRSATFEVAASFSRSQGNANLPAEYAYRKFLAFRGFGGPGCGVSVVVDPSSYSGMALGNLNGAVAGQGNCMYYNPFSNAHQNSAQPGAAYFNQQNPDYVAGLENSPELIDWINEEVNLDNVADLFVADALFKGELVEDRADYAVGYQVRRLGVSSAPNQPGDLAINPCPVLGDRSCVEKAGAFTFTSGFYEYEASQVVHRLFAEIPITLSERVNGQVAANYETHDLASSFNPKAAVRVQLADPLALRVSLQTTFRTPSADDLNEDQNTSLEYVSEAGIYKAVDTHGNRDLVPEEALTYNVGLTYEGSRARASLDYWNYDFKNVIDVVPFAGVTRLYDQGGASRVAIQDLVTCPDGPGTGTCHVSAVERIRVNSVNWPGIELSGIDWHLSARLPAGEAVVSLSSDGTFVNKYFVKALDLNSVEVFPEQEAAGKLNWNNPIAPPLPRWKSRASLGYHWGDYSLVNHFNVVSSYENEVFADTEFADIDRHATWDLSLLRRARGNFDVALAVINLLDSPPPLVNWEQSYDGQTHSPKGRRIKLSATYRPAG